MEYLLTKRDIWFGSSNRPYYTSNNPLERRLGFAQMFGPGGCHCRCGYHGRSCYCRKCNCNIENLHPSRYNHGPTREYTQKRYMPASSRTTYDTGRNQFDYGSKYGPARSVTPRFVQQNYWYTRGPRCQCSDRGCRCVPNYPTPNFAKCNRY